MQSHFFAILLVLTLPLASHADIFKCEGENGELTFSQTPCPNSKVTAQTLSKWRNDDKPLDCECARRYAPASANEMKSVARSSSTKSRSQQTARREARVKEQAKKQACRDRIRSQIDRINSRMRSGYTASQGIRLRERRRDLEKRLREC